MGVSDAKLTHTRQRSVFGFNFSRKNVGVLRVKIQLGEVSV